MTEVMPTAPGFWWWAIPNLYDDKYPPAPGCFFVGLASGGGLEVFAYDRKWPVEDFTWLSPVQGPEVSEEMVQAAIDTLPDEIYNVYPAGLRAAMRAALTAALKAKP